MSVTPAPAPAQPAATPPPKITIAGLGYVGLSNAVLLAQHNQVVGIDLSAAKVAQVNARQNPLEDADIAHYQATKSLNLRATTNAHDAYTGADFVIIATPTDYDPATNGFNTQSIEAVVQQVLQYAPQAVMVIKSTVPVGYTAWRNERLGTSNHILSLDFLCQGRARNNTFTSTNMQNMTKRVKAKGIDVIVYKRRLKAPKCFNSRIENAFVKPKMETDVVIATRKTHSIQDMADWFLNLELVGNDLQFALIRTDMGSVSYG